MEKQINFKKNYFNGKKLMKRAEIHKRKHIIEKVLFQVLLEQIQYH